MLAVKYNPDPTVLLPGDYPYSKHELLSIIKQGLQSSRDSGVHNVDIPTAWQTI